MKVEAETCALTEQAAASNITPSACSDTTPQPSANRFIHPKDDGTFATWTDEQLKTLLYARGAALRGRQQELVER